MEQKIIKVMQELYPDKKITPDTKLENLEIYTEFTMIQDMVEIDDDLGLEVPYDIFKKIFLSNGKFDSTKTIKTLAEYYKNGKPLVRIKNKASKHLPGVTATNTLFLKQKQNQKK
ncbi:MAG: hypothetical protein LBL75_03095 [Rickettsiales bacterium]|jgi:hypothetical protein|nr:hypothetical protein [Rickettsiales bacterium]